MNDIAFAESQASMSPEERIAANVAAAPDLPPAWKGLPAKNLSVTMATSFPAIAWAVPGLIPVGLVILAGRPKSGKSLFSLQLARAMACGGEFLGRRITQRRVWYASLEDGEQRTKRRALRQGWDISKGDAAFCYSQEFLDRVGFLNDGGAAQFIGSIERHEYDAYFLDTAGAAFNFDGNDYRVVKRALDPTQQAATKHGVLLWMNDHTRKPLPDNGDVNIIDDLLGTTAKTGSADAVAGLYKKRGDSEAVLQVVSRDAAEATLKISRDGLVWSVLEETGEDQEPITIAQRKYLAAIEAGANTYAKISAALGLTHEATRLMVGELAGKDRVEIDATHQPYIITAIRSVGSLGTNPSKCSNTTHRDEEPPEICRPGDFDLFPPADVWMRGGK